MDEKNEDTLRAVLEFQHVPGDLRTLYYERESPPGWIPCDGREVKREGYPSLFAVLGTIYGAGDGSTTFNVPDLQGAFNCPEIFAGEATWPAP